MAVVSRAIPTLLRGISQAADSTKQPDHADIQDNANSSPVRGLVKRSGTQFVTTLSSSTVGNVHIQTINRDINERYVAIFSNGNVKVYELDGTEKTVNKPDGTSYLNTSDPRSVIKTVTIADFTFVVNTSITTAMDSSVSPGNITQAVVFINAVSDKTTYSVTVDGVTVTDDTSSDSTLSTTQVASDLQSGLNSGLTGFTIARNGPVIHIKKNDGSNFSIDGNDTQGNTQLTVVKDSVQRFTDLPTVSPNGYVVEVKGDESTNFDNYYVKFVTNNGGAFEEGQWEESVEAGIPFKFDYDTMPHVLIRQADGNFRFARVDGDTYTISGTTYTLPKWGERTVGDLDSAPNPSFIDGKINNVFFFRNRLGFLTDDNVVLTRVSEFFNFFPETVLSVIDSDPIDVGASHTKVAILKHAVTMGEQLVLFSDQTQFVLTSSSDALTPKTANVVVATEFESSDQAQPVGSGSSIYYLTKKGSFAGVREYITQENVAIKDASNITVHVPRLIPSNIFKLAVSTNEDVLVLLGTDNPNKLYINRWLYGDGFKKVLNSWSTFTFNSAKSIKNIDFVGTDLFMVVEEANGTTLEKIPFEAEFREPNAEFEFHLDHKVTEATTGVSIAYNSSTDVTTFTLPYRLNATMSVVGRYLANSETSTFVDTQGNTKTLKPGQVVQTTNTTNGSTSTITANGDFRNSKVIIGEPYLMHYRFSQQRLTEGANAGEMISGRLQLHHFYIKFEDTGFFRVEVTPENRDTSTHKFTGRLLGASSAAIGQINLETGTFRVPIMSRADRVDIDVKNDTFLPTQLSSAEYEAMFHMRSRRV
jgi:hypothetical protein|tara:strand:- start:8968 stop:11415 length:2448 start_codon:yes stop_codon:yes gene_type:complete